MFTPNRPETPFILNPSSLILSKMVLSKRLQHKYESYSVLVELNGYQHKVIVTIFNGTDFEFHRHNSQSQQSINHRDFEKIKSMIIESFIVPESDD